MSEEVKVQGLAELARTMRALPDVIAKKALGGAVGSAAALVKNEAAIKAPVYTGKPEDGHPPPGTLRKAIYLKRAPGASATEVRYIVAVRSGKKYEAVKRGRGKKAKVVNLNAFYWRWVEFGTSKMSARPFLRPAFEAKKLDAVERIRSYLADRLPALVDSARTGH